MAKTMEQKTSRIDHKGGFRLDTEPERMFPKQKDQDDQEENKTKARRKIARARATARAKKVIKQLKTQGNGTFEFPFKIKVGKRFKIDREENGTTGLGWQAATTREIKLTRTKISPSEEAKLKLLGAGGQQIWSFQAKKKGIGFVFLVYKPTWLPEDPITDQQEFIYYDISK